LASKAGGYPRAVLKKDAYGYQYSIV
jgi:hypothetical protein